MSVLVNVKDPERIFEWSSNTFVGRRLLDGMSFDGRDGTDREISSLHAALTWNRKAGAWQVHDLGSVNGTIVEGEQLEPGRARLLALHAQVSFGSSTWQMRESTSPPAAARSSRGELRLATDDVLLLPDENAPELEISEGPTGWVARPWAPAGDADDVPGTPLSPDARVKAGDREWTVSLPTADLNTVRSSDVLAQHRLLIEVPRDQEHIVATLIHESKRTRLPSRRHHELWWLLARARRDATEADGDVGWVDGDLLVRQLGLSHGEGVGYLNVLVHRSRKQLAKAGFVDFSGIIERRTGGTPQLRLGVTDIEIIER